MMKPKTVRTSVSVPAEDYEQVERIAETKKVSVAWVIREAVEQYLTRHLPLFRNHNTPR